MQAERQCLRCGQKFLSEWIGNRICSRCKNASANSLSPAVPEKVRNQMKKRINKKVGDDHWVSGDDILTIRQPKHRIKSKDGQYAKK